ncbi:MAG: prolyl oligopeptidase family serine peptidase [Verrucomicrobiota bacterium]
MKIAPPFLRLLLLLALAVSPLLAAVEVTRTENVVYQRKLGVALTMDVFQPKTGGNGCGVIAVVSGGWKSSHEGINAKSYAVFLDRGYTVFAVVHGSQPKFTIGEIAADLHRAVRFIRFNAARWGVNPQKLGITGGSAGGHLSLTIATQGGPGAANAKDPIDRASSAVQAVACFYPPTDFLNYGKPGEDAVGVGILKDYRAAFGPESDTPEGRQALGPKLSPTRFITAQMPPALLIHGDADTLVPIQQSELFVQKATAAGATAKLVIRPGAGHSSRDWPDMADYRLRLADWFDTHLRQITPSVQPAAPLRNK